MHIVSRRHVQQLGLASLGDALLPAAAVDSTRVVLLLSGRVTDGGWGQLANAGIAALQRNSAFQAACVAHIAPAQIAQVARAHASDGWHLVIGHGFEFGIPLLDLAPRYPKAKFFVSSFLPQPGVLANILFADLAYLDVAYCAGALAALMSTGRKMVRFVGGDDNPTQQGMLKAFARGAERTVPGIQGRGVVTGDYAHAAKGLQAAAAAKVKVLGCFRTSWPWRRRSLARAS